MTEDQLIVLASLGDTEAFEELFNRYRPVVYTLEQKYYLKDWDHDDWLQEGRIVFFQTLLRFEAERGATIGKFYKLAFTNHILSMLRKQNALKRRSNVLCSSLEALEEQEIPYDQRDKTPLPDEYAILREKLADYDDIFSKLEWMVMQHFLLGINLEELTEVLNCPESTVRAAFDRGKRKLSNYLQDNSHEG